MKRSFINESLEHAVKVFSDAKIALPPQAQWGIEEWQRHNDAASYYSSQELGWSISDFGLGFDKYGGIFFNFANGGEGDAPYAQKLILREPGQRSPWHYHPTKTEDIHCIEGSLQVGVCPPNSEPGEKMPVTMLYNNIPTTFDSQIVLEPGDRLRIPAGYIHSFVAMTRVLSWEISGVNNDRVGENGNIWLQHLYPLPIRRYPEIEEDEKPKYILCNELPGTPGFDSLLHKYDLR